MNTDESEDPGSLPDRSRLAGALAGLAILGGLFLARLHGYLLFHSLAEGASIVVACAVFLLAWNSRRMVASDYLLFLGIAYLFVAALDLVHTLAYRGMGVFPGAETNLATQLWIAGRGLESLSLLAAPAFLERRLRPRVAIGAFAVATAGLVAAVFGEWFPVCFVEGQGLTAFKKAAEYAICGVLVASAVRLERRRDRLDPSVRGWILLAIVVTIASELAFTLYADAYGFMNLIGHVLKLASVYLVYKAVIETGLVRPYDLLFRELRASEEALQHRVEERTANLVAANERLGEEVERRRLAEGVLRTIRDVGRHIAREREGPDLARTCCECLVEARGYPFAGIAVLDEDRACVASGAAGPRRERAETWLAMLERGDFPPCARRALAGEGVVLATIGASERCPVCDWRDVCDDSTPKIVSIRHEGRAFGLLSVGLARGAAPDPHEDEMLVEVASDLALALHGIAATARHARAAGQLRELTSRTDAILEAVPDLILEIDEHRVCRWANRAGLEFFGGGLVGSPIDRFHEDGPGAPEVSTAGRGVVHFENRHRRADGERRLLAWNWRVLDEEGRLHALASAQDVTEREVAQEALRKIQEQLRQAQKLEAIGRLAGGVAHDFNNLLMVQMGCCDMIAARLDPSDPRRDDLTQIRACAERAARLTRQLLAFSRKQTLQPEVLDLNARLGDLAKMLRRLIGEDVQLVLALADGVWPVKADPGQLDQVVMNLVVNARDAMPGGGRLVLETANVELDDEYAAGHVDVSPGPYVMVAVTDTGCGMDEAVRFRIFEPFFTTKEQGKGTGLGLSTVYGIVRQSGGHVWVYSEPGRGSTFKVYLPRVQAEASKAPRPRPSPARGRGESILVVEDEPALRALFVRILEGLGYRVTAADGGAEAIAAVEAGTVKPDLLITDVVMPGLSGAALAERLRGMLPDLRIVFSSGYTGNVIAQHGVLESGTPFLQKPFSAADLAAKVRELLGPADPGPGPDSGV